MPAVAPALSKQNAVLSGASRADRIETKRTRGPSKVLAE